MRNKSISGQSKKAEVAASAKALMTDRWSNEFKSILSSGSLLYNPQKNKNDIS